MARNLPDNSRCLTTSLEEMGCLKDFKPLLERMQKKENMLQRGGAAHVFAGFRFSEVC
jgi:hypothetical protein